MPALTELDGTGGGRRSDGKPLGTVATSKGLNDAWAMVDRKTVPCRQHSKEEAMALISTVTPALQYDMARSIREVVERDCLTLTDLAMEYNSKTAETWVVCQLRNMGQFAGMDEEQSVEQLKDTALAVIDKAGYLKMTEIMHWMIRWKRGVYGRFYGRFDGMKVMESLNEFVSWRNGVIDVCEREARDAEREARAAEHRKRLEECKKEAGKSMEADSMDDEEGMKEGRRYAREVMRIDAESEWLVETVARAYCAGRMGRRRNAGNGGEAGERILRMEAGAKGRRGGKVKRIGEVMEEMR